MPTSVPRSELAPGFSVSRVLTGLWQVADMERDGGALDPHGAAAAMDAYVDAGLTTFDMADHYGSAEVISGALVARRGSTDGFELLTKWVPTPGRVSRSDVRAAVTRSLQRLNVERIDLLQFHAWVYADPGWLECLYHLQELQREGLIRHLGLTNVDTDHLRIALASGIEVVSNQVCYSLLDRRPAGRMAALCAEHGVKLLTYGTVAGGLLTEAWLGAPEPRTESELGSWSRMKYKRFVDQACDWATFQELLAAVGRVADRHGVSMANVACRYVLDQPAVGGIIVGARLGQREHISDNLRVFDLELEPSDLEALDQALAGLRPIPGHPGDEYRRPPYLTASGDLSHHVESFPNPYPTEPGPSGRTLVLSGTRWEDMAGYARAVRMGDRVLVSGTTATLGDRLIGGSDAAAQLHFAIDKIEGALISLGARLDDVVRTRVYIEHGADWEAVSRAHGERFGHIRPANTLVEAGLIGPGYLVEIEAEAQIGGGRPPE